MTDGCVRDIIMNVCDSIYLDRTRIKYNEMEKSMTLMENIRRILYIDTFVLTYRAKEEQKTQQGIALIAAAAFLIMSLLNIKEKSYIMLATTSASAVFLIIGFIVSKYKNNAVFLRTIFYIIFVIIFTSYTVVGGNEGFAALWLITATYAVMLAIDFKAGFTISFYYLVMLLLVFNGPLKYMLQFDYNKTFMLRFPMLYAINYAFATYIVVSVRKYQYELIIKQQELERINTTDLSTGLKNRNYFIKKEQSFSYTHLKSLIAIFIDVNGLHEINNCEGHDAGDKMLCIIADLCTKQFPEHIVYRMGGDEFLILCENADEKEVFAAALQLSEEISRGGYSISYGIEAQESNFSLNEIVKKADDKMLENKRNYYTGTNHRVR